MAKTFRKFTKEHRAKISAAKKRWAKKKNAPAVMHFKYIDRDEIEKDYPPMMYNQPQTTGLIDRMTQAIDKIETQIKRLESL